MHGKYSEWREVVAQFLSDNLPGSEDPIGWDHKFSTAYQIGCEALVKLGYATSTDWGAIPQHLPKQTKITPRWDDICISVLWLANQQNILSYRQLDGSVPPRRIGKNFVIVQTNAPLPPPPNIAPRFGLGPAFCQPNAMPVLEKLGLIVDGGWSEDAVYTLWRTSPALWSLDFQNDERYLSAVKTAVESIPDSTKAEISDLLNITERDIDEHIALHTESIEESRQKFGPKARLGAIPTREQAQSSLKFSRRNTLNWVFYKRWRISDGWLSDEGAKSALDIFHDQLANSMCKSVVSQLYPSQFGFFQ